MAKQLDTSNRFHVQAGSSGTQPRLVIGNPQNSYSTSDALLLAAWLVALADQDDEFELILANVRHDCP